MKSINIIDRRLKDPNWIPGNYDRASWFNQKLLDLGFIWDDDSPPHYKLFSNAFRIIVSPFPDIVVICENKRSFEIELYCHPTVPQNESEFDEFFRNIQSLI